MGRLYGCWLESDFDSGHLAEKIKNAHNEYFPAYVRRVDAIYSLAELFIANSNTLYPSLSGKLSAAYPSVISAIGRYINDIMHYKMWHDVKIANKAKMIAHTIKWLSHYNIINVNINIDEYKLLNKKERFFLLEINTLFIAAVIRYFLSFFCNGEIPSSKTYGKMFYLIDTGQYDVKTAAVAFDGMIL